jgi:hypothetical protein
MASVLVLDWYLIRIGRGLGADKVRIVVLVSRFDNIPVNSDAGTPEGLVNVTADVNNKRLVIDINLMF